MAFFFPKIKQSHPFFYDALINIEPKYDSIIEDKIDINAKELCEAENYNS